MGRNQRIKDALRRAGVSQEKLAERLNITQAAVGKQLNKAEDIDSLEFIDAVAELTGISRNQLLGWEYAQKGDDTSLVTEPSLSVEEEIYRKIVEGNTEYVLIPRSVLQEKYRLVALEQLEKDKQEAQNREKIIDKLLSQNEQLIERLTSAEAQLPGAKKVKKDS